MERALAPPHISTVDGHLPSHQFQEVPLNVTSLSELHRFCAWAEGKIDAYGGSLRLAAADCGADSVFNGRSASSARAQHRAVRVLLFVDRRFATDRHLPTWSAYRFPRFLFNIRLSRLPLTVIRDLAFLFQRGRPNHRHRRPRRWGELSFPFLLGPMAFKAAFWEWLFNVPSSRSSGTAFHHWACMCILNGSCLCTSTSKKNECIRYSRLSPGIRQDSILKTVRIFFTRWWAMELEDF